MPDDTLPEVHDRPDQNRYEIAVGEEVAVLNYRRHEDHVSLNHTEVPETLRGKGLAQKLARHAMDEARRAGTHVVIRCPFLTTWLERHPEYNDLVIARVPGSTDDD